MSFAHKREDQWHHCFTVMHIMQHCRFSIFYLSDALERVPKTFATEWPREKATSQAVSNVEKEKSMPTVSTALKSEANTQPFTWPREKITLPKATEASEIESGKIDKDRPLTGGRRELIVTTESTESQDIVQTMTTETPTTPQAQTESPCLNKCPQNEECRNVNGLNKCICKKGFIRNGIRCERKFL